VRGVVTRLYRSFRYAYEGLAYAWGTQPNLRLHLAAGYLVLVLASILEFRALETVILLLTVGAVVVAELFNTAVEAVVNVAARGYHPQAKIAKDVAAAAVLITTLLSVLVGLYLFGPALARLPGALQSAWLRRPGAVLLHGAVFLLLVASAVSIKKPGERE